MKSGNIVFYFDDILVDKTLSIYRKIRNNWSRFHMWFTDYGPLNVNQIYERKTEILFEWLLKDVIKERPPEEIVATMLHISELFNSLPGDIYSENIITDFAKKTLLNPMYIENASVNKIFILAAYDSNNDKAIKKKIISSVFNHTKIIPILYPAKKDIISVMRENGISYNLYVTDSIRDIRTLCEANNGYRKEFLVPRFGYMDFPDDLRKLIEYSGGSVNLYDPKKELE